MEHNMKVSNPCANCVHKSICMNTGVMDEVQHRVNDQFFNGQFGMHTNKYQLLDDMSKAKITVTLSCANFIGKDEVCHEH